MAEVWRVDKTLNIGSITAIIGLVIALGTFVVKFDSRITSLEVAQQHMVAQQQRDREDTRHLLKELRSDIKYIRERIDSRD